MSDIKSPTVLYIKGLLFLVCGCCAAVLVWLEAPTLKSAILIGLTVWCFSRAYYFAFYVVEHYIDDSYRFAGLIDFFNFVLRRRRESGIASGSDGKPESSTAGNSGASADHCDSHG